MEIKKGDIVFCIENVIFNDICLYFKKGDSYRIKDINGFYSILIKDCFTGLGVQFYLEDEIRDFKKFSDYFIILAEWREQQIDCILND